MSIITETRSEYYLITPSHFEDSVLEELLFSVEKALMERPQSIVLSLGNIESIFSVHISVILKLYKRLHSMNLKFILVDISLPILNVLQMTKLETLFPIFITQDEFEEYDVTVEAETDVGFEYSVSKKKGECEVVLEGFLFENEMFERLLLEIEGVQKLVLDFEDVAFAEWGVLDELVKITAKTSIRIEQASALIIEFLEDKGVIDSFEIAED